MRGDRTRPGPAPRLVVAREFLRALGGLAGTPLRFAGYLLRRRRWQEEVAADLRTPAAVDEAPIPESLPGDPLRIFISCAEHSGEIHARSLVRALRAETADAGAPAPDFSGLGGERLRDEGVDLVGDTVAHAAMGADVLGAIPSFLKLLTATAEHLRRTRPHVLVMVDSPALHVPLGRIAKSYGIPVLHFVTPQYWGWAPWRVRSYARAVDLALTILPFEPAWFRRRGVRVAHVGHPLLDALEGAPAEEGGPDARVLALLPGSRAKVIRRNLPWMLVTASRLRLAIPDLEVVIPAASAGLEERVRDHLADAGAESWVAVERGDLHATLGRAGAALSVSGTVLLDLLHHRLPAVVVYRVERSLVARARRWILTVPWFSSVNLLAGREVLPEHCFHGLGPVEGVSAALHRCYNDAAWRAETRAGLDEAARRLGPPGASQRAARHALFLATSAPRP